MIAERRRHSVKETAERVRDFAQGFTSTKHRQVRRPADCLIPVVILRGARLHRVTEVQCVEIVIDELEAGRGGWIITMNLDHLRRFVRDRTYARYNSRACLVTADGMPLVWASHLQGTPLPERVTGSNLVWSLTKAAALHARSVFLLGGRRGAAQKTAQILRSRYPYLRISGAIGPKLGFENSQSEMARLEKTIVAARPDIVYVALGCPKQEHLIERLRHVLPKAWWLGVGVTFSFVCGEIPRAPMWMQQAGLEWLHRLGREPRRLAKRYLVHGIPFAFTLFASAVWHHQSDSRYADR